MHQTFINIDLFLLLTTRGGAGVPVSTFEDCTVQKLGWPVLFLEGNARLSEGTMLVEHSCNQQCGLINN